ncbi:MAG: hypothetical protein WDN06_21685 [Asticcacaulis sp.]
MAQSGVRLMARQGWAWAPLLQAVLDDTQIPADYVAPPALEVWSLLEEWEDQAPEGHARAVALTDAEVSEQLGADLARAGPRRAPPGTTGLRAAGQGYLRAEMDEGPAQHVARPKPAPGVGKTLGYLAPAIAWAKKAQGQVWVSTYTKALQKQIYNDTRPVRHGRRTRQCRGGAQGPRKLSLPAQFPGAPGRGARRAGSHHGRADGAMVLYSRDGDILSGDFPTWLPSLLPTGLAGPGVPDPDAPGPGRSPRGECTYAACPHYRVCFIEKIGSGRRARRRWSSPTTPWSWPRRPTTCTIRRAPNWLRKSTGEDVQGDVEPPQAALSRIIFDEGHHVFEAADGAFATRLSGLEAF